MTAPTASAVPTPTEASATPAATGVAASPEPTPASAELDWTRTASFPVDGGLSIVHDVARVDGRYVAVGVEFVNELPVFGPLPPHEARAWTSIDGRSWRSVDLGPGFENVRFGRLIQRTDGTLLALGARGIEGEQGINETEPAAGSTTDGLSWEEVTPPFEGSVSVEQGPKGMLAVVDPSAETDVHELWLSSDGQEWDLVRSVEADYVDIDAGDEGFAAIGWTGGEDGSPFVIACPLTGAPGSTARPHRSADSSKSHRMAVTGSSSTTREGPRERGSRPMVWHGTHMEKSHSARSRWTKTTSAVSTAASSRRPTRGL